jgi:hypothetical protein
MRHLIAIAAVGCQGDVSTPFPPGLEPFADDDQPALLDGTVAERLTTHATNSDFIRVYGRGFIFAPPADVYAAAHIPEVMYAACSTTAQTVTLDNEPEYELSFLVHYFVDNILNVEWDDQWRGQAIAGTRDAPELVMIKHQKIQGSSFIALSEGTVKLIATADPGITELQLVEHLDALSATPADVIAGMHSNYDRLLAVSRGDPIPACVISRP